MDFQLLAGSRGARGRQVLALANACPCHSNGAFLRESIKPASHPYKFLLVRKNESLISSLASLLRYRNLTIED